MSALENEIKKYKKRGFEVRKKRTKKQGKVVLLTKKTEGILGGFIGAGYAGRYIYYVDGDSSTKNIREFLKGYSNFYIRNDWDTSDKGIFLCSGKIDKGLFRDLKKSLVRDKDIASTISIKTLPKVTIEKRKKVVEEERIKERITEREIMRRRVAEERISLRGVLKAIRDIPFIESRREKGYEKQLFQFLYAKNYPVIHESLRRGARFDLILGDDEVALELKIIRGSSDFRPLIGQVMQYRDQFRKIIVVLIDRFRNPSVMKKEIKRIEGISPENVKVIVK